MTLRHEFNPDYIHHNRKRLSNGWLRELVFGMEDGMVSTLGAITGIAAATQNQFTVVMTGLVVVAVESISMGVGSYLSNKSEQAIDDRMIYEEKTELEANPHEEKIELKDMYIRDGWPDSLAVEMAEAASKNSALFLREMAYRELEVIPEKKANIIQNSFVMFVSYILGGAVPVVPYLLVTLSYASAISIVITLLGLFLLGVVTTKYNKRVWWKAGLEMAVLASVAALVGYTVGQVADRLITTLS